MAPPAYIISRAADPIFALAIGIAAAVVRINREEKEKGRTTQQTVEAARRYVQTISLNCYIFTCKYLINGFRSRLGFPTRS
jgi:hypothetical protein